MKILVTGGAGFIGSHIVEHFHETAEVVVLDNLRSGFERNLDGLRARLICGSVTDPAVVDEAMEGADFVFHLAALVSVPESMEKPQETVEINTLGTLKVLESARRHKVKKVVLSSSAAIYGDNPTVPKVETMLPEPKSPYAVTKLDGELYLKMFHAEHGLETISLRYFNVFGPRQDPKSQYSAAIPIFVSKAIHNEDIVIFGDGEQTRDFIFVKDVAAANALAASTGATGVYNVAKGGKITINALAEMIIGMTGSSSRIVHAAERAGDVKHSLADTSRIRSLGFSPSSSFDEGLQETVAWFAHPHRA